MKKLFYLVICLMIFIPLQARAASLISSIEVEGVGPLGMARKTYNLDYSTSFDYVNITATPASEDVTITGAGKVDITEGQNSIVISATDGTNSDSYTINLNVTKISGTGSAATTTGTSSSTGNPETGAFMPILAIIGAFAAAGISVVYLNKNKKFNKI